MLHSRNVRPADGNFGVLPTLTGPTVTGYSCHPVARWRRMLYCKNGRLRSLQRSHKPCGASQWIAGGVFDVAALPEPA